MITREKIAKCADSIVTDMNLKRGEAIFIRGEKSKSSRHWDFVTHPSATIEIADTNEVIMKDGEIL